MISVALVAFCSRNPWLPVIAVSFWIQPGNPLSQKRNVPYLRGWASNERILFFFEGFFRFFSEQYGHPKESFWSSVWFGFLVIKYVCWALFEVKLTSSRSSVKSVAFHSFSMGTCRDVFPVFLENLPSWSMTRALKSPPSPTKKNRNKCPTPQKNIHQPPNLRCKYGRITTLQQSRSTYPQVGLQAPMTKRRCLGKLSGLGEGVFGGQNTTTQTSETFHETTGNR